MLSKEEIEKAKEIVKSIPSRHMDILISEDISIAEVLNYIQQLETREQKLIDKLEEDIEQHTFDKEIDTTSQYAQEILSIIKLQSNNETQ